MDILYVSTVYRSDLDLEDVAIGDNNPSRGWNSFLMKRGVKIVSASVSVAEEISIVTIEQEDAEYVDVPIYQTLSRIPLPPQVVKHGICLGSVTTEEVFQHYLHHKIPGDSIVVFLLPEGFTDHPPYLDYEDIQ